MTRRNSNGNKAYQDIGCLFRNQYRVGHVYVHNGEHDIEYGPLPHCLSGLDELDLMWCDLFPALAERVISKILFWLFNIGLPIMIIGVGLYLYNQTGLVKVIISIGAIMVSIAVILFAINVLMDMKKQP